MPEAIQPKIGVFFLAGESWWDAGVCAATEGPYAGFLERVQSDAETVARALGGEGDVVSTGLMHTVDGAVAAARQLNEARVDCIVFCPIIWTNDPPVVAFLREVRRVPLMLWAYSPYVGLLDTYTIPQWLRSSGAVSVQQSANILRRFGWDYEVAFGNEREDATMGDLRAFVRAAAVRRSLIGARIAMLPAPCRAVISTWVDQHFLLETFGIELTYVSVESYAALVREVPAAAARAYVGELRAAYPVAGVSDEELFGSARQALAFVRLAEEEGLAGIALEDFNEGFYRILGTRPHLTHPRLSELGCTVGMEADVLGVLATLIVGRLSGGPAMFNELFTVDPYAGTILMGHPGHGEVGIGEPGTFMVTRDLEIDPSQKAGAWLSYRARSGPMTFLNLTPAYGRLKAAAFTGESLPGPAIMEGYSHMVIAPGGRVGAVDLYKRAVGLGLLQHWGTALGWLLPELGCLFRMLRLELTEL